MADFFTSLSTGIKFKEEKKENTPQKAPPRTAIQPNTKDANERVNLVLKHHNIKVSGNNPPAPVQVSATKL